MIFITGDCHADFHKFSTAMFPDQKTMTRDDFVIVCGDFGGVWNDSPEQRYWLDWLGRKSFTILFVDGNHENFDMLYEYPVVDFHGGKAHKIKDNVYHLMRGYVFDLCGKKFFAFGGASSHDISDGIIDPADYETKEQMLEVAKKWYYQHKSYRIKGLSWWPQELPNDEEYDLGRASLSKVGYNVDYVISHCLPQEVASVFSFGTWEPDKLTAYFNQLIEDGLTFNMWYCGHYHAEEKLMGKFEITYHNIFRIE